MYIVDNISHQALVHHLRGSARLAREAVQVIFICMESRIEPDCLVLSRDEMHSCCEHIPIHKQVSVDFAESRCGHIR